MHQSWTWLFCSLLKVDNLFFFSEVIPYQFKFAISLSFFLCKCNDFEIGSFSLIRGHHGAISGDGPRRVHVRGRGGESRQDAGAEVIADGVDVYFSGWSSRHVPPGAGEVDSSSQPGAEPILRSEGVYSRGDPLDEVHPRASGRLREPYVAMHPRAPVGGFSIHGFRGYVGGYCDPQGGHIRHDVLYPAPIELGGTRPCTRARAARGQHRSTSPPGHLKVNFHLICFFTSNFEFSYSTSILFFKTFLLLCKVLELGIIAHSIIIGIALGASHDPNTIKPLVAALTFHQLFERVGLGKSIT